MTPHLPLILAALLAAAAPLGAQFQRHRESHGDLGRFASAVNLIEEGSSFEVGYDGFSVVRQLYAPAHGGVLAAAAIPPEFASDPLAPHGSRALKLANEHGDQVLVTWHWVTVTGDPLAHRYVFSLYARTDSGTLPFVLKVRGRREVAPGQYTYWAQDYLTFTATPSWERYSLIVQPRGTDPFDRDGEDPEPFPVTGGSVFEVLVWFGRWRYRDYDNPSNPPEPENNGILYLDAVQFEEAPLTATAPSPYEYPTRKQEMAAAIEGAAGPRKFALFDVGETGLRARVSLYEEEQIPRSLDLEYFVEDAAGTHGSGGSVAVPPDPQRHPVAVVDLDPHVPMLRGLYRVTFALNDPITKEEYDRQEALLARIRPRAHTALDPASPLGLHIDLMPARHAHGTYVGGAHQLEDFFDLAQLLGARHLRNFTVASWARCEWLDDDVQPFEFWDEPVLLAAARGMDVMPILGPHLAPYERPPWVTGPPTNPFLPGGTSGTFPDLAEWGEYVTAVVERYRDLGPPAQVRVAEYEVCNEPVFNLSVDEYAQLLQTASAALRLADPQARVVAPDPAFAEYAVGAGSHPYPWVEPAFTAEVFAWGGGSAYSSLDINSQHYYAGWPMSHFGPFELGFGPGRNPDNVVERIELTREIMRSTGQGEKPIWNSETGWVQPVGLHGLRFWRYSSFQFVDAWSGDLAECRHTAAFPIRSLLQNLGEGVERYYHFRLFPAFDATAGYAHSMTEFDGSPRVALTAYSFATELLEGAVPFQALREADLRTLENDGMTIGYVFDRPAATAFAALWNYDDPVFGAPPDKTVRLLTRLDSSLVDVFDMEGRPGSFSSVRIPPASPLRPSPRYPALVLDRHPTYLVARPGLSAAELAARLTAP